MRIKFLKHLRTLKVHQKNYLKFILPKGDLLGTARRCKKARSIKLLQAPGTFRESIRPQKYSGLMSQLINAKPSTYKEAGSKQIWVDAMIELQS